MLRRTRRTSAGFSLIELMVTISVIGIALVIAVPSFGRWTADASVRAAAESLTSAIRQTQSLAISRGRTSMFALTSDKPPTTSSIPAQNGTNWFAELNPLTTDEPLANQGLMLKSTDATLRNVTVNGPALICFSSTGRQSSVTTQNLGACAPGPSTYSLSRTGATRQFQVQVFQGGRVRMCDASKTLSTTNPDGC